MINRNETKADAGPSTAGRAAKGTAWRRLAPMVLLALAAAIVFGLDLHTYLSLDALRQHRQALAEIVAERSLSK